MATIAFAIGFVLLGLSAIDLALYSLDWNHKIGVGSSWSYHASTPSGLSYNETETLDRLELCGYRICGVYEATSSSGTSIQWRTSDWRLQRSLFIDPVGNSRDLRYDSGVPLYHVPLVVGDSWSWDTAGTRTTTVQVRNGGTVSRQEHIVISGVVRQVMREELIEVPAGSFQSYVIDQFDENNVISQRIWFNLEIGAAVKYIGGFFSVYRTTWQLTNYSLVPDSPLTFFETKIFSISVSLLLALAILSLAIARVAARSRPASTLTGGGSVSVEGRPTLDGLAHVEEVDSDGYGSDDQ